MDKVILGYTVVYMIAAVASLAGSFWTYVIKEDYDNNRWNDVFSGITAGYLFGLAVLFIAFLAIHLLGG